MADVFVSYKKEDRAAAERVVAALRADGRTVWWDDGLTPQRAWDATIEHEIEDARAVLVLWSPRSVRSDWVRSEAHYAQDRHKLIPVVIEPCTLPIAFMLRQAVDLSRGVDRKAAEWSKLAGWLDLLLDPDAAALAPQPDAAGSMPGRAAKPTWALAAVRAGALVLILAAIGALAFALRDRWLPGAARPDVVVDAFTIPPGAPLPAGFAADLGDEMFASFSASSRIAPRTGTGARDPAAYQVSGRIDADGDTLRVYAKVFAPDIDAPVLTTRIERPRSQAAGAPLEIGLLLASTMRCIATASDSSGSTTTTLPADAMKSWARFCNQSLIEQAEPSTQVATLRAVVAAAPRFANGWSNLGEMLFVSSLVPDDDWRATIVQAVKAADMALAIDPSSAKAYMVKAWITAGFTRGPDGTLFSHHRDFAAFEALAHQAVTVRPSDCGCEVIQYGLMLFRFGRLAAAFPYLERGVTGQSYDWEAADARGLFLAILGRTGNAKAILEPLGERWPAVDKVQGDRLLAALWRSDWPVAKQLLSAGPATPESGAMLQLVGALSSGDRAAIGAAGQRLRTLAADPGSVSEPVVVGLGLAGQADDALTAATRLIEQQGYYWVLWEPSLAQARQLPRFAAVAARTGLMPYWRMPGHRPDFCRVADPPALCAQLSAT